MSDKILNALIILLRSTKAGLCKAIRTVIARSTAVCEAPERRKQRGELMTCSLFSLGKVVRLLLSLDYGQEAEKSDLSPCRAQLFEQRGTGRAFGRLAGSE